jgi:hypothetical protein
MNNALVVHVLDTLKHSSHYYFSEAFIAWTFLASEVEDREALQ